MSLPVTNARADGANRIVGGIAHLDPIAYVLRLYKPGDSFEQGSRYCASATVQVVGNVAHIAGLSGTISRAQYRAAMQQLASRGVTKIVVQRRGKVRCFDIGLS